MMHKVFAFRLAWFTGTVPKAMRLAERSVLEQAPQYYVNPKLSKPAWIEHQDDGIERICVEIEFEELLPPPDVERSLKSKA